MRAFLCTIVLALSTAASLVHAQVYKWTDEKGVVNYSNSPPPEGKSKKGVSVVEDRVSVYSADPAVVQATQNARERRGLVPPQTAAVEQRPPPPAPAQLPAPPITAVDPCINGYDPVACGGYYTNSPAFAGRHRPPHLIQPNLPPGATAGNVNNGAGFTPGLSTQSGLGAQPPARPQRPQSAPLRDR
jgi:hypothetical protein